MGKKFNVYLRDTCLVCKQKIDRSENKRIRSYCSATCRIAYTVKENNRKRIESGRNREIMRERNNKKAEQKREGSLQCALCGRWYLQLMSHVRMTHGVTAREYNKSVAESLRENVLR